MSPRRTISYSASQDWCTPPVYAEAIREFFSEAIALDPCSNDHSIVNADIEYVLPAIDGLTASWEYPTIYVNPPYGRDRQRGTSIRHWLRRCAAANRDYGSEVLALVPVAPNTSHWKDYVFGAATGLVFLYDTRLKFYIDGKEHKKGAPQACSVVYWGERYPRFEEVFIKYGAVLDLRHLHNRAIGINPQDRMEQPFEIFQKE